MSRGFKTRQRAVLGGSEMKILEALPVAADISALLGKMLRKEREILM